MPEALTVRVITTTIGLASEPDNVLASSSSTQLNMKQKNNVTPIAPRFMGKNTRVKK
jgi:hypothetical protein